MIAEDLLARAFLEAHPARAARKLERMPVPEAAAVLAAVPARTAAPVLREMTVAYASECLAHLPPPAAAAIVAELTADDASDILRPLQPQVREPLLAALSPGVRDPVARVLTYPAGTAGAVMDPAIFQLPQDVLVADARDRLNRARKGVLYYIYVVDRERRLVGVLDIAELIFAPARDPVRAVMHRGVDRLDAWMPVALVRQHAGWQDYHAMPVVDEDDRLLGVIRYQTLRRLEHEAADRGPDPARITAGALAELFQLSTRGFVAGISATAPAGRDLDRPLGAGEEVTRAD